jgi:hypothetical protein
MMISSRLVPSLSVIVREVKYVVLGCGVSGAWARTAGALPAPKVWLPTPNRTQMIPNSIITGRA